MVSRKVTIKNPTGLHLRPAGILCKTAMQFKSQIEFFVSGEDEEEALNSLVEAIESGLGE